MANHLQKSTGPLIGAHHLGGVGTTMMVARDLESGDVVSLPLRLEEQRSDGAWVFAIGAEGWRELLDFEFDRVCLVAQVDEKFVTIDADFEGMEDSRVVLAPRQQTYWDVPSGRVFRVASSVRRSKSLDLPIPEAALFGE